MQSDSFKTGYTFRFPRVQKVRYDKSWKDCLTTVEFAEKQKVKFENYFVIDLVI